MTVEQPHEVLQTARPPRLYDRIAKWREPWHDLRAVLPFFLLSRLVFYAGAVSGGLFLPPAGPWPGRVEAVGPLALHWRWDAVHYYSVAVGGYPPVESGIPAFFPLLPLLIRAVATVLSGFQSPAPLPPAAEPAPLLAGIAVGHAAALLAFWLLFGLARAEAGAAMARRATLYAAIFPLAFFYAVPYTEALFLATSAGTFLTARRGHWVRAGLWAAAASATRLAGVLLLPVLLLEIALAWRRGKLPAADWPRALGGLLLAPLGLILFMLHLWQRVGDPLAFLHAQANYQRQWVFPLMTVLRGISYTLNWQWDPSGNGPQDDYLQNVLSTLIVLGFLAVTIVSMRRWRPSYTLYAILLFAMILTSPLPGAGAMSSLGRYSMVLFPVYLTLARWGTRPLVHRASVLCWLPLSGLLAACYTRWYFIA